MRIFAAVVLASARFPLRHSAMVAGDKIGVALHPVSTAHSGGKTNQYDYDNLHFVFS
jgi:hypothetical protein